MIRKALTRSIRYAYWLAGCGYLLSLSNQEFDEDDRMKASSYDERIVDVMENLLRFRVLLDPQREALTGHYSECQLVVLTTKIAKVTLSSSHLY